MNGIQKYSKSLLAMVVMLAVVALTACSDSNSDNTSADNGLTVLSTGPVKNAVGVATNSRITATFNEAINIETLNADSFTVATDDDGTQVMGAVSLDADTNTARFQADADLATNTAYIATITTAVTAEDGNVLSSDYEWGFTTGAEADNTAPTVTSTDPAHLDTDVAINRKISANFSEAMYLPSLNTSTFLVTYGDAQTVTGDVEVIGTTAVFIPAQNLISNTNYTAELTNEIMDLAGNPLPANVIWNFTTGESVAKGPAPVTLGTSGNYVILAKTGISTTGTTAITGDIAISPAPQSYITGFSETLDSSGTYATSGFLYSGKIFASDMAVPTPSILTTAISDMKTAYTDAAGRSNADATELGAGDISGLTLEPGLYKWSTGVLITSDVTLEGDANDVWILQIAKGLTIENDVSISLTGGALPKNVFWQVAEEISFGTDSNAQGVFLGEKNIAIKNGATLIGRVLAQTAVTLDANAVTQPAE